MNNLIVGIVGEICSGKSTVCQFFRDNYSFKIIENDDEVTLNNIGWYKYWVSGKAKFG